MLPGGSPDNPCEVGSASLVEVRARSERCASCEGELDIAEHLATTMAGKPIRVVNLKCKACGATRSMYFRVTSLLSS
ncbi:MAG: hypothetical protein U0165_19040 [Polyangiaceae bacterium]